MSPYSLSGPSCPKCHQLTSGPCLICGEDVSKPLLDIKFLGLGYPRYFVYAIDKHQTSPKFYYEVPPVIFQNADDGCDVIVDLVEKKRYWCGNWVEVTCQELKA